MMILKLVVFLRNRMPWFNLPITFLVMLLQRTPVLKLITLGEEAAPSFQTSFILKSAFVAAASLGSVHTLVGASGIVTTPTTLTATVGVASTGVVFTVAGADSAPQSWVVTGSIPPGMNFSGLTSAGTVNVTTSNGYATLTGTPTLAGTYTFSMVAYSEINAKGYYTTTKSYTVTVKAGASIAPTLLSSPPATQVVATGSVLNLSVIASGTDPITYQWKLNGTPIAGATASALLITSASAANAGNYTCVVTNSVGTVTTPVSTLVVANPPVITASPVAAQSVPVGSTVNFSVSVSDPTSVTYQWQFNGVNIFGASSPVLTLNAVTAANAGTYVCVVSNLVGVASSTPSVLNITAAGSPTITTNPVSQTIAPGSSVVFKVVAKSTTNVSYQWKFNGVALSNASSSALVVSSVTATNAGNYTCVVTNAAGSVTSAAAQLSVLATNKPGRLVNLSVLTMDGPGAQMLTLGFVNGGLGTTGSQPLLVRASGPTLAAFSVPNVLADPTLALYQGSSVLVSNDNWGSTAANIAAVNAADSATGAFAFSSTTSLDSAVVQSLVSGSYTVQVVGNGSGVGTTLAEVYDNTTSYSLTSPRLVNLSCRQLVPANGMLTAGFVINGDTSKTVLIRASGPTLTTYGVPGVMPDPQINVYSGTTVIASNAGWAGDASIAGIANTIGAFPYASSTSKDSAVLITLAPGSYTAQASSSSGTSGTTIVEVYEVP